MTESEGRRVADAVARGRVLTATGTIEERGELTLAEVLERCAVRQELRRLVVSCIKVRQD